ncbi:unnamed protein product [Zymoseptoria tritici ST99CH_1E4]|uniref:Mid2 domain-containing protein n=1 Tax=Zymoseptoria tritici ST99CH_1E4 TaxID=1276532 RepID=A0A2H1GCA1_ZYMTR|nr:unnamed protein product [Zymoseptoria tritici ST99CH_1E4]
MASISQAVPWLCAVLPTLSLAAAIQGRQTQESSDGTYESNGGAVDTEGGASGGSSGSFNLSKGGLIAIIVVVVIVVILGAVMTVLFVVAKRRQWNIRQSIQRASRRLTGRGNPKPSAMDRQSKRGGMQMKGIPARDGSKSKGWR